jgi:hypothetical protein
MVHECDPHAAPDTDFEPGRLEHLVPGNRGRMLDPRRTPVSLVAVDLDAGFFHVHIEAFEDRGAVWEIPLERIEHFQFARDGAYAEPSRVESMRAASARFDRLLEIACDPKQREQTRADLARRIAEAASWLRRESRFLRLGASLDFTARVGSEVLAGDLVRFVLEREVTDLESAFTEQWVSNPHSGERVKGHRIVLAELGLVPYSGTVVRRADLFDPPWDRTRRAQHLLERIAFVRALFAAVGLDRVVLYRGLACDGSPAPPRNDSFVSASFSFDVARSCMGERDPARVGVLLRQAVPVDRLFMTYLETAALNRPFQEAEAVLLWDERSEVF